MQWILPAAFIILPFGFLSIGSFKEGQIITLVISAFAILAIKVKPLSLRLFCWYVAGWTAYRHIYKIYIDPHFGPAPNPALNAMLLIMAAMILYISVTESGFSRKWLFSVICGTVVFQALLGLGQTLGYNPAFDILPSNFKNGLSGLTATGTLGNQDYLMAFIAISLPLFFRKHWIFALILFIPILFISKVSTAVFAALIGTSAFFWKGKSFVSAAGITIFAAMLGMIYLTVIDNNIIIKESKPVTTTSPLGEKKITEHKTIESARGDILKTATKQINTWPKIIFGLGPGSPWGGKGTLHNEWFAAFRTFGLIGLVLSVVFVFQSLWKAKGNSILVAALVAASVNMLGNSALQYAPTLFLILILFGLAQREVVNG